MTPVVPSQDAQNPDTTQVRASGSTLTVRITPELASIRQCTKSTPSSHACQDDLHCHLHEPACCGASTIRSKHTDTYPVKMSAAIAQLADTVLDTMPFTSQSAHNTRNLSCSKPVPTAQEQKQADDALPDTTPADQPQIKLPARNSLRVDSKAGVVMAAIAKFSQARSAIAVLHCRSNAPSLLLCKSGLATRTGKLTEAGNSELTCKKTFRAPPTEPSKLLCLHCQWNLNTLHRPTIGSYV